VEIGVCAHNAGVWVRRVVGEYVRGTLGLFFVNVCQTIDRQEERERAVREKLSRPFEGD